jgi:hypothetical protein
MERVLEHFLERNVDSTATQEAQRGSLHGWCFRIYRIVSELYYALAGVMQLTDRDTVLANALLGESLAARMSALCDQVLNVETPVPMPWGCHLILLRTASSVAL